MPVKLSTTLAMHNEELRFYKQTKNNNKKIAPLKNVNREGYSETHVHGMFTKFRNHRVWLRSGKRNRLRDASQCICDVVPICRGRCVEMGTRSAMQASAGVGEAARALSGEPWTMARRCRPTARLCPARAPDQFRPASRAPTATTCIATNITTNPHACNLFHFSASFSRYSHKMNFQSQGFINYL